MREFNCGGWLVLSFCCPSTGIFLRYRKRTIPRPLEVQTFGIELDVGISNLVIGRNRTRRTGVVVINAKIVALMYTLAGRWRNNACVQIIQHRVFMTAAILDFHFDTS